MNGTQGDKHMDENSVESYYRCIDEGLFAKRQKEILRAMIVSRKGTARGYSKLIPGAWKHFANLRRMGLIKKIDNVTDTVTNRTVGLYDLADDFVQRLKAPLPLEKATPGKKEADVQGELFPDGSYRCKGCPHYTEKRP